MTSNQALPEAWENVALAVLEQLGRPVAPDPVRVALFLGLTIAPSQEDLGSVLGATLRIPDGLCDSDFGLAVARCVARWLLQLHHIEQTPDAVTGLAGALLRPSYANPRSPAKVYRLPGPRGLT